MLIRFTSRKVHLTTISTRFCFRGLTMARAKYLHVLLKHSGRAGLYQVRFPGTRGHFGRKEWLHSIGTCPCFPDCSLKSLRNLSIVHWNTEAVASILRQIYTSSFKWFPNSTYYRHQAYSITLSTKSKLCKIKWCLAIYVSTGADQTRTMLARSNPKASPGRSMPR